jgi:hypothetical protein
LQFRDKNVTDNILFTGKNTICIRKKDIKINIICKKCKKSNTNIIGILFAGIATKIYKIYWSFEKNFIRLFFGIL